jgi:hypothetical protein
MHDGRKLTREMGESAMERCLACEAVVTSGKSRRTLFLLPALYCWPRLMPRLLGQSVPTNRGLFAALRKQYPG